MNFIEELEQNFIEFPDRTALKSKHRRKGLSYGELDQYSGRVYAYLKKHKIGKENFVLICLPRGIRTIVAAIGVWKAGAAFTIVEDTYAPERIDFIKNDCGCRLVIDEELYFNMMMIRSSDRDTRPSCTKGSRL